jgi:ubiquinone/menaquinone biosynthesis C-methylase UbiE
MVELDNPFAKSNRAAFIVGHMELQPGMTVLDAGCGPGRVTIPLAKAVAPDGIVVAADLQEGMLKSVAVKAREAGIQNVKTLREEIGQGKLDKRSFDRALVAAVLGEVPDRGAAMAELFRTLRPGGMLAIAELIFDPHFQRRSVVSELALGAGFRQRAIFGNRMAYMLLLEKPE